MFEWELKVVYKVILCWAVVGVFYALQCVHNCFDFQGGGCVCLCVSVKTPPPLNYKGEASSE